MPSLRCEHCGKFTYIPTSRDVADGIAPDPVPVPDDVIEETDRTARAYGWEIGKGQPIAEEIAMSPDNPFNDPEWRDRHIRPS